MKAEIDLDSEFAILSSQINDMSSQVAYEETIQSMHPLYKQNYGRHQYCA